MIMKKQTKQDLIDSVARRWKDQYCDRYDGKWASKYFNDNSSREIEYEKLLKAKTEKEIIEIIENNSWTKNSCVSCGYASDHDTVVFLGENDEYASELRPYCKECLTKALAVFEEKK
jgi:predicted nucleic-acid-binding Zn-ribbon protein